MDGDVDAGMHTGEVAMGKGGFGMGRAVVGIVLVLVMVGEEYGRRFLGRA